MAYSDLKLQSSKQTDSLLRISITQKPLACIFETILARLKKI